MGFPISAGTGPAAAILVGGFLYISGNSLGVPLIIVGIALSAFWALKFK